MFIWIQQAIAKYGQDIIIKILAAGPVPKHVAFVMDGNRRYARKHQKEIPQGHSEGFVALKRVLEVCLYLGVSCVTVYAFAIDNFKRSPEEVDALMHLAETKLVELCEHGDLLDKYGVRLNVLGRKELLPEPVRAAIAKAEDMTRNNKRAILNVCMPYGSRDEITTAVQSSVQNAMEGDCVVTEEDIESNLMTTLGNSPPLDILIRTSGVKRLSDFLLWQCCEDTQIHFTDTFWPDFALTDFIPILLDYQRKVWSKPSNAGP
ncbi:dehydrodolichyl diphosphate synthetase [Coprinopsis cinerea okayama7|uniref:Alkyl transferase n=1 Tax=Coprinopsis cinerea (strain Okayama-7 / 130 / ATCC MYA-4618 / FGSC 9003) TaxID=240176 RepID=A8NVJ8_COPC7|nr:dehydrodolichyl diphosphate synthetase [Coprinopsis cinerea okayama7\|eukprot:XP_001836730.1 dehydrodolichyl diphosphate synthetase [Coprinopsis cinerea okayama7\